MTRMYKSGKLPILVNHPLRAQITVNGETRVWRAGEWLIFDDSFEHAVHIGASPRLVLIVDVFHPHLTATERQLIRTLLPDVGGD